MRLWLTGLLAFGLGPAAALAEPAPTYVGSWGRTGSNPGYLRAPAGIAVDAEKRVYVVELGGHRVQVFSQSGELLFGWGQSGSGPGDFYYPSDVALDTEGHVWIADRGNHRLQCFNAEGRWLSTYGSLGRGIGQFLSPNGICIRDGHLFVADTYNHRIHKFALAEADLVPALVFGDSGSGSGQLDQPRDVDVTAEGLIYVADSNNNRVQIFESDGRFRLRFGGAQERSPGRLSWPFGVTVDAAGNVYTAEPYQHRLQKFAPTGCILATWGPSSIKVQRIHLPLHMGVDAEGLLYVCDYDDTGHSDRIVIWRPIEVPTPVVQRSWTDVRSAFR